MGRQLQLGNMGKVGEGNKLREKERDNNHCGAEIQEIVPRFYNRRKEKQLTS